MSIGNLYADEDNILTIPEAAKLKNMPPELLRYYINHNRGPDYFTFKERRYMHREDVIAWEPVLLPNGRRQR